jgi:atlastin
MSAVSVIKVENNRIIFDHEAFSRIINRDTIGSKEICIISITGCFGKGKSFLLNFLLRYLEHNGKVNINWIQSQTPGPLTQSPPLSSPHGVDNGFPNNSSPPLKGFTWRGSGDATTEGILIWSEPYILKNKDGNEVAILLMDTQGSFNVQDTLKTNADIFALSTLLSSVQILNTSNQIMETDLQALEMFTSYSRCYDANKEGKKPFQRLVYLIRDFEFEKEKDDGYGFKVGSQHWENRCNTRGDSIKSWFESFDCYVMPDPGKNVKKDNFSGCLHEIKEKKFVKHIQSFTEWMFLPENLFTKKVMGKILPNEKLTKLFQHYDDIFKDRKVPSPTSLMEAHLKTFYEHVEQKCIEILDSAFKKFCDAKLQDKLMDFHEEKDLWKRRVFDEFNKEFPAENSEVKEKFRQMLEIKFLVRLQDHYKFITYSLLKDIGELQKNNETLQKDKETLQEDKETLQEDKERLQKDKERLQGDKESYKNLLENNEKTIGELRRQLEQEKKRLRDEIISNEAFKKEKEEEIVRKEKVIQELENNEARLINEKENVIQERTRVIQEIEKETKSAKLLATQLQNDQQEVIEERIRIVEAQDIENEAKNCSRSMTAIVKNESNCIFHLIESKLSHGVWLRSPPCTLLKKDSGKWATSSNGVFSFSTGGIVVYECKKCSTNINFSWTIPWWGKNEYNNTSNTFKHSILSKDGGDSKVVFHYTIKGAPN